VLTPSAHPHEDRDAARVTFDRVAGAYDSTRPGYPSALFADLRAECSFAAGTRVLEVGCGTGQATRVLAGYGCDVQCVELGPDLAARARANLAAYPNATVTVGAFEAVDLPDDHYDVVFSATAFHWIDPAVSYARAARVLRGEGSLVLVTNAPVTGGTEDVLLDTTNPWRPPSVDDVMHAAHAGGDIAAVWTRAEKSYTPAPDVSEWFERPTVRSYPWIATYDTAGYLGLMSTQSSYLLMDETQRREMLRATAALVDERLGGEVTKQFVAVCASARRITPM
jgi:SAM-dependent methyltransferase